MSKIYSLFLVLTCSILLKFTAKSQCSTCNITNPTGNINLNGIVCFTQDCTLSDVTLGSNVTICIASGKTVTIANNIFSNIGNKLTIMISDDAVLNINQSLTIKADLNLTISKKGLLKIGGNTDRNSDFKFEGNSLTISNAGAFNCANFQINNNTSDNNNAINKIVSNGNMNIVGSLNITNNGAKTLFQNEGILNISQNYTLSATTTFENCGTMVSESGLNLGGGSIYNTGSFTNNSGNIDMGAGKVFNYGTFTSKDQWNGQTTSSIYNEGIINVRDYSIANTIQGPKSSIKKGYFYVQNKINPLLTNMAYIDPNLDFTKVNNDGSIATNQGADAIFNDPKTITYIDQNGSATSSNEAGVTFHCVSGCPAPIAGTNACPETPIVTPVQLVQFSATNNHTSNNLYWSTASEINFKYFEVEKSINSTDWDSIGSVTPKGSSSRGANYTFVDYNLSAGTNWYKLKMVDMDGTKKYSNIIALNSSNLATTNTLKVFPNPVKRNQQIQIQYNSISSRKIVVKLIDLNGRIIYSKYYSILSGLNSLSINIDTNITGVYLINLIDERNVKLSSSKIIVQ